jgi:two-component system response regulator FixJ
LDLTVFIVDDDQAARESLTFLLRTEGLMCRAYASALAFLHQLQPDQQGCIITDVRMPDMDGIALVNRLREIGCRVPIIVITGHADVPLAVQAMKAGVSDFIEKPFESDAILAAVRRCLELSRKSEVEESLRTVVERRLATLTERELQVCGAVVEGLSNKEVALSLAISPRTVEIYRANVMAKMQAGSLSELVRMLLQSKAA